MKIWLPINGRELVGLRIVIKKGTKKGTYKVRIKVTAAGEGDYLAGEKIVTVKVKVK